MNIFSKLLFAAGFDIYSQGRIDTNRPVKLDYGFHKEEQGGHSSESLGLNTPTVWQKREYLVKNKNK